MSAKDAIFSAVKDKRALGNSNRKLKHLACDLLHASGQKASEISKGTFLCPQTIERVMDCPEEYRPQAETLERILTYFNGVLTVEFENIKPRYQNKPKPESEQNEKS